MEKAPGHRKKEENFSSQSSIQRVSDASSIINDKEKEVFKQIVEANQT